MFEKYTWREEQGQKEQEIQEIEESQEEKELRESFVQELKTPYENSYFQKLKRIAGAFVLAGFTLFASPKEVTLPEISKQSQITEEQFYRLDDLPEHRELFKEAIQSLKKRGGLEISPQLPEQIYKPEFISDMTRILAMIRLGQGERPYFKKPETILGKEFIEDNPEKTQEYLGKIKKAMKATVYLERKDKTQGSGVIINTKKGKVIITNEHVVGDELKLFAGFITGFIDRSDLKKVEVIAEDAKRDLAILSFPFDRTTEEELNALGLASLDIEEDPQLEKFKKDETLASIGHPLGFPFEVALSEFKKTDKDEFDDDYVYTYIVTKPDKRFDQLALYDRTNPIDRHRSKSKGDLIEGMSGGPIISLDREGEIKLVGINVKILRISTKKNEEWHREQYNIGISSKDIKEFLKEKGFFEELEGLKEREGG
jgi:hypothetical protein